MKLTVRWLWAFLFLVMVACSCNDAKQNAKIHYEQGLASKKEGNVKKATEEFYSAIRLNPGFIQAHREYQDLMLQRGRKTELVEFYRKQTRDNPRNPAYFYLEGRLLDSSKERIGSYQEALSIDPNYLWALDAIGLEYLKQGTIENAIKQMKKVIEIDSEFAPVHLSLCRAFLVKGNYDAAYSEIRKFLELEPGSAQGNELLGQVMWKRKQPQKAIEAYQKALELYPERMQPLIDTALIYHEQKNHEKALEILRDVRKRTPQNPALPLLFASIYKEQGRNDEARAETLRALEQKPDSLEAEELLGELLLASGAYEEAKEAFSKVLSRNPRKTGALTGMAEVSLLEGDMARALSLLKSALAIDGRLAEALRMKADILAGRGNLQEALGDYRAVLKTDEQTARDHFEAGLLLWQLKEIKAAREEMAAAMHQEPDNIDFIVFTGLTGEVKNLSHDAARFLRELSQETALTKISQLYTIASLTAEGKNDAALSLLSRIPENQKNTSLAFFLASKASYGKKKNSDALLSAEKAFALKDSRERTVRLLALSMIYRIEEEGKKHPTGGEITDLVEGNRHYLLRAKMNYEAARLYALMPMEKESLLYLRKAFNEGFRNKTLITGDKAFASLRKNKEFQDLFKERSLENKAPAKSSRGEKK
ncbi:MAG: tetratricopeptide repeat protein [Candidatus Eremiobacteraeota bacterium]|nr:tetratricopeptide repeat protein [Candidatus Eremiobacteraeota bacterium]